MAEMLEPDRHGRAAPCGVQGQGASPFTDRGPARNPVRLLRWDPGRRDSGHRDL